MSYILNGGSVSPARLRPQKSLQPPYTSEHKHAKTDTNFIPSILYKNGPAVLCSDDRRIQSLDRNDVPWSSFATKDSDSNPPDAEIVRYIEGILGILSKVPDDNNAKTCARQTCKFKPENKNLSKLLSLRLGQLTKIKELYAKHRPPQLQCSLYPKKSLPVRPQPCVKKPVLNLSEARFDSGLLSLCLKSLRWKSCNYNAGDIYWLGMSLSLSQVHEFVASNRPVNYPRIAVNRYPGTHEITRKAHFYRIVDTYSRYTHGPTDCFPKSFRLPDDLPQVLTSLEKNVPLIFKPSNGSMGQGVKVVTVPEDICEEMLVDYSAQEYVSSPLLLDGKKFDLRVYLLLVGVGEGLRGYISRHSLVRVCTEKYEYPSVSNTNNNFMHLTNYSINKSNILNYHRGEDVNDERNNKRPLVAVLAALEDLGYDADDLWAQIVAISEVAASTISPEIYFNAKLVGSKRAPTFFQIFGLDVIIDVYGKAWLLEVNCCPSLKTNYYDGKCFRDDSVDLSIKVPLITEALKIVNLQLSGPFLADAATSCPSEDWEALRVTPSERMANLMVLFKIAKNESWKTPGVSKTEWIRFCRAGKITELARIAQLVKSGHEDETGQWHRNLAAAASKQQKDAQTTLAKSFLGDLYAGVLGKRARGDTGGLAFSQFVELLEACSSVVERWIKPVGRAVVGAICRANGIAIDLDLLSWTEGQPHNSTRAGGITASGEFLNFLNHSFCLEN